MIKTIIVFIAYLALYHVVALSILSFIDMKNWLVIPFAEWSEEGRFYYVLLGLSFAAFLYINKKI